MGDQFDRNRIEKNLRRGSHLKGAGKCDRPHQYLVVAPLKDTVYVLHTRHICLSKE